MYQAHTNHIIFRAICKVYVNVIYKLYICDNWQYVIGPKAEIVELFIEDQAFLRSYDLAPAHPHPLPHPSARGLSFSVFLCVAGRAFWRDMGGGGVLSYHTTARKPGPL